MFMRSLHFVTLLLMAIIASAANDSSNGFADTAKIVETQPSDRLRSKVEEMFERGSAIRIRFAPLESMGRASYGRDSIMMNWKSAITLRCGHKCSTAAPRLRDGLSAARRVEPDCPSRFAAMISFLDDKDREIGAVYVHESRQCIVIDDVSYFVPAGSLSDLIEGIDRLRW